MAHTANDWSESAEADEAVFIDLEQAKRDIAAGRYTAARDAEMVLAEIDQQIENDAPPSGFKFGG